MKFLPALVVSSVFLSLTACSRNTSIEPVRPASYERKLPEPSLTSPETKEDVAAIKAARKGAVLPAGIDPLKITGKARIGVLYYTDRPAHREALLNWFKNNDGEVTFESQKFGYIEAALEWDHLDKLIATSGDLGLSDRSLFKLEIDVSLHKAKQNSAAISPGDSAALRPEHDVNTSYTGPVHSSGYGTHIDEFRKNAARDLGMNESELNGKGTLISVFDGGTDLSRTDVYGNRIRDFVVGEDDSYETATQDLDDLMDEEKLSAPPKGLEDIAKEPSLRFVTVPKTGSSFDLNGSGDKNDEITVAVYLVNGHPEARFRPTQDLPFGDKVRDFGEAHKKGLPTTINLYTGKYYTRTARASPSAAAVKFRLNTKKQIEVAVVGIAPGADHGIANLHMAGGDFTDGAGKIKYQGVATGAEFIAAQPWKVGEHDYGSNWLSLARTIIRSTEAGADVLDLDIFAPGTRGGVDLLNRLLCRITDQTKTVPVVASHNYGPLQDTIQSLAQGTCVLGIGASTTAASLRFATRNPILDPSLTEDDQMQTASYSGRGFGMNGQFKPDIISPAYGYTSYGEHFIRFSGTSGATPTTAGLIALLKQAARAKGVELNFGQVKFLLQGSSMAVNPEHVRDGYGYSNLAGAWELFKAYYDGKNISLHPFRLEGQSRISFDGRPTAQNFTVNLTNASIVSGGDAAGSDNTAQPMKFWIEYGGDSTHVSHWLKFLDRSVGTATETLDWDAPMSGETQPLGFVISLSDADWDALPDGDHVAVIKGVRKTFAQGRNVDFILPVSFTKASVLDESNIPIRPLYADQHQTLQIATRPGERLQVQGSFKCEGNLSSSSVAGQNTGALALLVDNKASYDHASMVMNTYAPLNLDPTPITILAEKNVVRMAILREGFFHCDGPMTGSVLVRRLGFDFKLDSSGFVRGTDQIKSRVTASFKLNAEALADSETYHGVVWKIHKGSESVILRMTTKSGVQFTLPKGVQSVRVVAQDSSHFAGLLIEQKPSSSGEEKKTDIVGAVEPENKFTGGFAQSATLELAHPSDGNFVRYIPFMEKDSDAATSVLVEVAVAFPGGSASSWDEIGFWASESSRAVSFDFVAPSALPSFLAEFPSSVWSYSVRVPFSIHETQSDSSSSVFYVDQLIWGGSAEFALPWL